VCQQLYSLTARYLSNLQRLHFGKSLVSEKLAKD
jgi:hypothetical protein